MLGNLSIIYDDVLIAKPVNRVSHLSKNENIRQGSKSCSWYIESQVHRSSSREVFFEKGVLRNFAKFTRKTQVPESFLIKLQGSGL